MNHTFHILILLLLVHLVSDEIKSQIVSPEVVGDKVTFRLRAFDAKAISVIGINGQSAKPLVKKNNGVWEATVGPLSPELYSYQFDVDGTKMIDPSNRQVKKWLSLNSMFEIKGGLLHERHDVPHGVVHHHIYDSKSTGHQRGALVYTPPGYAKANRSYPVVYLLHGYGDDETAWTEVGRAHYIADNLLAKKEIEPLIIVMPYGHPLKLDIKKEFDDYADQNIEWMEKDLLEDLRPFIAETYRIEADRSHQAIVGLSMGGGQSLHIGLKHVSEFAWIGGFSSAAPQGESQTLDQKFESLVSDVDQTNSAIKLLWIGCGKDDFLLKRNEHFVSWLKNRKVQHNYRLTDGGHDWMVWRKYLAEFLKLSFRDKK